jgi:hypothetical protein
MLFLLGVPLKTAAQFARSSNGHMQDLVTPAFPHQPHLRRSISFISLSWNQDAGESIQGHVEAFTLHANSARYLLDGAENDGMKFMARLDTGAQRAPIAAGDTPDVRHMACDTLVLQAAAHMVASHRPRVTARSKERPERT